MLFHSLLWLLQRLAVESFLSRCGALANPSVPSLAKAHSVRIRIQATLVVQCCCSWLCQPLDSPPLNGNTSLELLHHLYDIEADELMDLTDSHLVSNSAFSLELSIHLRHRGKSLFSHHRFKASCFALPKHRLHRKARSENGAAQVQIYQVLLCLLPALLRFGICPILSQCIPSHSLPYRLCQRFSSSPAPMTDILHLGQTWDNIFPSDQSGFDLQGRHSPA